ncbi:putative ATP-dependent RNA helicase DHX35-like [Apostichopus japonicus]|uniref:RNA helicase n=1 Tax=Stichopus japonicus TaxID=307972 RepID=A0A2G8LRY4_STIJA|nr:putative ATP-dependent RNA helicase DHX35-like [Apostichopus japonicus]
MYRNHILYLLEKYQTLVLVGETGSGKSTQIPQYLLEAGWGNKGFVIGITQPRRVAAVTVAQRIAEERGSILGQEIGYAIRFENFTNAESTRIKFMTDGYLVQELMRDPLLLKYSVIVLDEAHERSLYTDISMGLLKKIQRKRADLRIVIASATLDAEKFQQFFNQNETDDSSLDTATILSVEGRSYPVDIMYTSSPVPNYLDATVNAVQKIHETLPAGDVLAFLTGQDEVEKALRRLIDYARDQSGSGMKLMVLPMYSNLPAQDQMKVFQRMGKNTRKVVLATNIAETSITINGICYVIDCGFHKLRAFSADSGIDGVVVAPVSQASATQRAGRAGRLRSGKAFRLYTETEYNKLPQASVPEMQRSDLGTAILQLKCLGIDNVLRFNFPSAPSAKTMIRGLDLLYALGAIDDFGKLTEPLGIRMADFPLEPKLARMILVSGQYGCTDEAITIAAMLQVKNIFHSPPNRKLAANKAKRKFAVKEGDHITLLNVYDAFISNNKSSRWCQEHYLNYKGLMRSLTIREQLERLLKKFKLPLKSSEGDVDSILRCIVEGFYGNAARYHPSGCYRTIRDNNELHIHPTSVLYSTKVQPWVVFHEILRSGKDYMRDMTVIDPKWLYELAPHYYQYGTEREIAAKRLKVDHSEPT